MESAYHRLLFHAPLLRQVVGLDDEVTGTADGTVEGGEGAIEDGLVAGRIHDAYHDSNTMHGSQ